MLIFVAVDFPTTLQLYTIFELDLLRVVLTVSVYKFIKMMSSFIFVSSSVAETFVQKQQNIRQAEIIIEVIFRIKNVHSFPQDFVPSYSKIQA